MNVNNGQLSEPSEDLKELFKNQPDEAIRLMQKQGQVPVNTEDLTMRQKIKNRVSLKDHKSKVGKKLTYERNRRCDCGSGLKFKNCCLGGVQ